MDEEVVNLLFNLVDFSKFKSQMLTYKTAAVQPQTEQVQSTSEMSWEDFKKVMDEDL